MTFDFAAARQIKVDSQVRPNDDTDMAIQHAMRRIAREDLCPPDKAYLAYADCEIAYAPGRVMMRPRDVAKLLQTGKPRSGERALAVAAPYAAAVLEAIGLSVTRLDTGDLKSPPAGPYDLILCEASAPEAPKAWLDALAPGGRLVLPVRVGPAGRVRLYVRGPDGIGFRDAFDASPPVLAELQAEPGFVF